MITIYAAIGEEMLKLGTVAVPENHERRPGEVVVSCAPRPTRSRPASSSRT